MAAEGMGLQGGGEGQGTGHGVGWGSCHQLILLPDGTDLHLGELEGILPAGPGGPLDAVGVGAVVAPEILPVEVGGVAVAVPPGAMVEGGAVVLRVVVVQVLGGELHPVVLQEGVTCLRGKESWWALLALGPSPCPVGLPWAPQ